MHFGDEMTISYKLIRAQDWINASALLTTLGCPLTLREPLVRCRYDAARPDRRIFNLRSCNFSSCLLFPWVGLFLFHETGWGFMILRNQHQQDFFSWRGSILFELRELEIVTPLALDADISEIASLYGPRINAFCFVWTLRSTSAHIEFDFWFDAFSNNLSTPVIPAVEPV